MLELLDCTTSNWSTFYSLGRPVNRTPDSDHLFTKVLCNPVVLLARNGHGGLRQKGKVFVFRGSFAEGWQ